MELQDKRVNSSDLFSAVLIEMKEKGFFLDDLGLAFPLGPDTKKKLHKGYYEASEEFPAEMDGYGILKRAEPYCNALHKSIHLLRITRTVWLGDDGIAYFKDEETANEFLNPNRIENYPRVKKIASFIIDKANL